MGGRGQGPPRERATEGAEAGGTIKAGTYWQQDGVLLVIRRGLIGNKTGTYSFSPPEAPIAPARGQGRTPIGEQPVPQLGNARYPNWGMRLEGLGEEGGGDGPGEALDLEAGVFCAAGGLKGRGEEENGDVGEGLGGADLADPIGEAGGGERAIEEEARGGAIGTFAREVDGLAVGEGVVAQGVELGFEWTDEVLIAREDDGERGGTGGHADGDAGAACCSGDGGFDGERAAVEFGNFADDGEA